MPASDDAKNKNSSVGGIYGYWVVLWAAVVNVNAYLMCQTPWQCNGCHCLSALMKIVHFSANKRVKRPEPIFNPATKDSFDGEKG